MAYYKQLITGAWAKCKVLDRTDYFTYIQVLDNSHAKARKLWVDSDFVVPKEEKPKDRESTTTLHKKQGNQLMTWDDHVQEAIDNGKLCEAWLWSLDASGNLAVEDKETLVVKHLKDYFYDHYVGTMDSEEIDKLLDLGGVDE